MSQSSQSGQSSQPGQSGAALVTGAGRRIGRAIALDLALNGWNVAVHYRNSQAEAEGLVREIRALGCNAEAIATDLADGDETLDLVASATEALGPLDLLVNSASIFEPDSAQDVTAHSMDRHLAVNLRAPVLLSRAFAEQLAPQATGTIVNIVDQRVWKLTPHYLSYTASKVALWGVTQTMAQALAPRVRVNAIGPGPTLANERQDAEDFAAEAGATLLGHGASLGEIGAAIRFIVDTPSMTGQMIALDGGQHLAWRTPDVISGDERSG